MHHDRIPARAIISNVVRNLGLKAVSNEDALIEWCYEAEVFIGSEGSFPREECELEVKNNRAVLPKNFYKLHSLKVGDNILEYTDRDFRLFHKESPHLAQGLNIVPPQFNTKVLLPDVPVGLRIYFSINEGFVNLSLREGKIGMAYYKIHTDEEGFPTIHSRHEMATTAYCMWQYKTSDYVNGLIPQYVYRDLEQRWIWLCGEARGNDNMPDRSEMEYLSQIYNSFLPFRLRRFV